MLRNPEWRYTGAQPRSKKTQPDVQSTQSPRTRNLQSSRGTRNCKAAPAVPSALVLAGSSRHHGDENQSLGDMDSPRQQEQHGQERSDRHSGRKNTYRPTARLNGSGREARKLVHQKTCEKLGAVDRRYFHKKEEQLDNEDFDIGGIQEPQPQEEQPFSGLKSFAGFGDDKDEGQDIIGDSLSLFKGNWKEVDLHYTVVKWSSQRPESPAADLALPTGWWESAYGYVEDQFIVLQLANKTPQKLHVLDINLPGNDCSPRTCWLSYSTEGENGPWREAWGFQVMSKSDSLCRSSYETGVNNAKDFKEWLARAFRGGAKEACETLFGCGEGGFVDYPMFSAALTRCRQYMFSASQAVPMWCNDVSKLFAELDFQNIGKVSLDDLERTPDGPPEAAWWKISFENNWGSTKKLQVMAPLRIYSMMQVKFGRFTDHKNTVMGSDKLVMAFDLTTLGVPAESVQLRRLAKKYCLSILDIEYMHSLFQATAMGQGEINHPKFDRMLLQLHGTDDLSDVPSQRLRFFWQQADNDSNGTIDFEEFIMWYDRYGEEISSRKKTRPGRRKLLEDGVDFDRQESGGRW